jgi:hypothetical protein
LTVTLTFNAEIEAGLLAKAQAKGMALEDYLQSVVERDVLPPTLKTIDGKSTPREEAVRRMIEFGENHHLGLGQPITRELLHEDHRF